MSSREEKEKVEAKYMAEIMDLQKKLKEKECECVESNFELRTCNQKLYEEREYSKTLEERVKNLDEDAIRNPQAISLSNRFEHLAKQKAQDERPPLSQHL